MAKNEIKAIPSILHKNLDDKRLQEDDSKSKDETTVLTNRRAVLLESVEKNSKELVDTNSQALGYKFMAKEIIEQAQKIKAGQEIKAGATKTKKTDELKIKLTEKYRFPQEEAEALAVAVGAVISAGPEAMLMAAQVMREEAEKKEVHAKSLVVDISTTKERIVKINEFLSKGRGRDMRMDQVTRYLKSLDDSLVREMMVRHLDQVLHDSEKKKIEQGLT